MFWLHIHRIVLKEPRKKETAASNSHSNSDYNVITDKKESKSVKIVWKKEYANVALRDMVLVVDFAALG